MNIILINLKNNSIIMKKTIQILFITLIFNSLALSQNNNDYQLKTVKLLYLLDSTSIDISEELIKIKVLSSKSNYEPYFRYWNFIKPISFLGGVIKSYGVSDVEEWVGCCPGPPEVQLEIKNAKPFLVEKYCKDYGCTFVFDGESCTVTFIDAND